MTKNFYKFILSFTWLIGFVLVNCDAKNEFPPTQRSISAAEKKTKMLVEKKKWEASPDGIKFKEWQTSTQGKKIKASYDKVKKPIKEFSDMEAVVTSMTFQRENSNSTSPKWLIVNINGAEYMLQFIPKDFQKLSGLKVNDKIIIKSRSAGYSPNHPYLILSSDYIAQNDKILFKRIVHKNKC